MRRTGIWGVAAAVLALAAGPAAAENRAVVVVQDSYANYGRAEAPDANALLAKLRGAGLRVANGFNLNNRDLRSALGDLARPDPEPGARIVVMSGQFVSSESDSWLLAADAGSTDLATADLSGVPAAVAIDLMRDGGGRSVLFLADAAGSVNPGARLKDGVRGIGTAGPVNVVTGSPQAVATAAAALLVPGTTLGEALKLDSSLRLVQGAGAASVPIPRLDPLGDGGRVLEGEAEAWVQAAARNSVASYEEFLRAFPGGRYADVAHRRLEEMRGGRDYTAQLAEVQLNLSRAERAQVQRQLTLLTYDTRGIDGIFGNDTRAALTRWQRDNGLPATGYLNADAVKRLKRQSEERGGRLEAEARKRQEAAARRDDAYWEDVGQSGGVGGLRAYLKEYPEGRHAAEARRALARVDGSAAQKEAWDRALRANTLAGYQEIIDKYPKAPIAQEARERMAALKARQAEQRAEDKLGLTTLTRQLIEGRLAAAGLDPGPTDGAFDAKTRTAIRAYQQSRNLRATGYMNESTMVRLLADTLVGF